MIDHKRKFIFLHIPKCAGTSVGNFFINYFNYSKNDMSLFSDFNYYEYDSHRIHFDELNKDILNDYFVFTIIRNPYDRFVSEYRFNRELDESNFDYYCENFESIWDKKYNRLIKLNSPPDKNIKEIADGVYNNIHRISQTDYLKGTYSDFINKINYVNKFVRFETIEEDMNYVFKNIGISNTKLPHLNSSNKLKSIHKDINMDEKNKEIIYDLYKDDFINFGYSR
jgi:hypothetical protein